MVNWDHYQDSDRRIEAVETRIAELEKKLQKRNDNLFKRIWRFLTAPSYDRRRNAIEEYLAQSVDLVDLERRQREITRRYGF